MRQILYIVRNGLPRHHKIQISVAKRPISHNAISLTGFNKLLSGFCKHETGPYRWVSSFSVVSGYGRMVPVSRYTCATAKNYSQLLLYCKSCIDNKKSSRDFQKRFSSSEGTFEDDENCAECKSVA